MALSSTNKAVFRERERPLRRQKSVSETTHLSSKSTTLVEDTRENRQKHQAGPQSVFEIYWPFYFGFGLPVLMYCVAMGFYMSSLMSHHAAGLISLVLITPGSFVVCFVGCVIFTRILVSLKGAAQTTHSLFRLTLRSPGFRKGAALGLTLFLIYEWSNLSNLFNDFTSTRAAQLTLLALGFIGIAATICHRLERLVLKLNGMKVEPSEQERQAQEKIASYKLKIALHWPVIFAAICVSSAAFFEVQVPRFLNVGQDAELADDSVFLLGAFVIMWLYFILFSKLVQKSSKLFGLVTRYQ
ncbi:MAG: hypothetical protein AAGI14_05495 [Pseudomonadota bacterium]